ncbi:ribosome recycling factor [Gleimia coleocanis DSM 15436]|uniref:Ribosome-recycling factor n=1 Tax=Gleimia coleocanis DSM 15436 TaxID=525245 RepID=C0W048_9ACTO|nr:ribosome recycling factor [Gleimia coleocanis]EEH63907.1 ribosome recycling factor [Gleimia coleocanis DSM 15436]
MIEDAMLLAEEGMEKALAATKREFGNIRTGRANPETFNSLLVDYYGAPTPLQQLASVQIPEARMVLVSPYDRSAMQAIITAIRESDLGVNPTDDGNVIRCTLPALTEERRKEYVKLAKSKAEDGRVSIRNVRRKAKEELDRIKKDGEAGEDEVERAEKELETLTKNFVAKVDAELDAKEKDLMTV